MLDELNEIDATAIEELAVSRDRVEGDVAR